MHRGVERPTTHAPSAPDPAEEHRIRTEIAPIRIASIPAAHPYVRAISDPHRVHVLPDPPVPGAPAGQWWPPQALTADWLLAHAEAFDVLHVHFGLESFSPAELRAALDAAQSCGRPVVYTVHDLDNPQIVDQEPYRALLDVIVPRADRLVTLTAGAAAEIERRWHRPSRVIPHPTLLDGAPVLDRAPVRDSATDDIAVRVGIHLRDLRPNIDAEGAARASVDAARLLAAAGTPVVFEILVDVRVRDDATAARVLAAAEAHADVHVRRVTRLSDAEIETWLGDLDLFVLPYRHGTHSGWVELCHDLGVPVAGTAVGHVAAQHPAEFSVIDLDEPQTLATAVRRAAERRAPDRRDELIEERALARRAERDAVRAAHVELYRDTLSAGSAPAPATEGVLA